MIYVPNGSLSGNAVTNYSKQDKRRVEWVFGVEYGEDVKRVRAVLQRIINADSRILDTPAPHRLRFTERKQRRHHGTRMGKERRLLECTVRYQRNCLPDIQ